VDADGAVGMASVADRGEELKEERPVAFFEDALFGADAEGDFCLLRKVAASAPMRARANSRPRQRKESSAAEITATSQLGRMVLIRAIESAKRSRAVVSLVAWTRRVATLPRSAQSISIKALSRSFNSKQTPLRGGAIQVGHALADERGTAMRREQVEAFDEKLPCCGMAADIEPEDAEG